MDINKRNDEFKKKLLSTELSGQDNLPTTLHVNKQAGKLLDSDERDPKVAVETKTATIDNYCYWYDPDKVVDVTKGVKRRLCMIMGVCAVFITIEIIGGLLASSIAILADAAH